MGGGAFEVSVEDDIAFERGIDFGVLVFAEDGVDIAAHDPVAVVGEDMAVAVGIGVGFGHADDAEIPVALA